MAITNIFLNDAEATTKTKAFLDDVEVYARGGGYDAATQALLDQATSDGYTAGSGDTLMAKNALIVGMKELEISTGVSMWDKQDVLGIPATNGDSDFACYNVKAPATFQATKVNSPVHTANEGFEGNAIDSRLELGYTPSVHANNMSLNDACVFIYNRKAGLTASDYQLGAYDNTNFLQVGIGTSAGKSGGRVNNNATFIGEVVASNHDAFWMIDRPDASTVNVYKNGVLHRTQNVSSTALPTVEMMVLALGRAGSPTHHSDAQVSIYGISGSLGAKALEVYNLFQTYMTAIGKQV